MLFTLTFSYMKFLVVGGHNERCTQYGYIFATVVNTATYPITILFFSLRSYCRNVTWPRHCRPLFILVHPLLYSHLTLPYFMLQLTHIIFLRKSYMFFPTHACNIWEILAAVIADLSQLSLSKDQIFKNNHHHHPSYK